MKNSKQLSFCLFLLALYCFHSSAALAKSSETKDPKFVQIPVFYVTDREKEKDTFNAHRKYILRCKHDMYYGKAYLSLPNDRHLKQSDLTQSLNWQFSGNKPLKISKKDFFENTNPELAKKEFFDSLAEAVDRSKQNKLCIFLHGADDCFEEASSDAAELGYYVESPILLYSWPSVPKMLGYIIDNGNNEWSQAHFEMFIRDLQAFKSTHPIDITVVAHSMGNRLVIRAAHLLNETGVVSDFELSSPDFDLGTCAHYLDGLRGGHAKARLYFSRKDKMLALSQYLFGGYYRLGEGVSMGLVTDQERDKIKAAQPNRFARIDFTAIDEGFRGHSIPFQLIADMVHFDKPEHRVALETIKVEKSGRLAGRIASRHLGEHPSEITSFERVVRIKNHKRNTKQLEATKANQ